MKPQSAELRITTDSQQNERTRKSSLATPDLENQRKSGRHQDSWAGKINRDFGSSMELTAGVNNQNEKEPSTSAHTTRRKSQQKTSRAPKRI
jgi:hypothetical protein